MCDPARGRYANFRSHLAVMYEVPSKSEIGKVLITPEVVSDHATPTFVDRGVMGPKRTNKRSEEKSA